MNLYNLIIFTIALISIHAVNASEKKIVKVRIESCPGCQLNRLPEVRKFIYEDIPKYKNAEFKKIPGAPPEAVFLDEDENELERHELNKLNRKELHQLMSKKGFEMDSNAKEL